MNVSAFLPRIWSPDADNTNMPVPAASNSAIVLARSTGLRCLCDMVGVLSLWFLFERTHDTQGARNCAQKFAGQLITGRWRRRRSKGCCGSPAGREDLH